MTRTTACLLALLFASGLSAVAHADTVTYDYIAGKAGSGTFSGTLTFDQTTDSISAANFSYTVSGATYYFDDSATVTPETGYVKAVFDESSSSSGATGAVATLELILGPSGSITGICTGVSNVCGDMASTFEYPKTHGFTTDDVGSNGLSVVGYAPEPSSLFLLGTGALGLAGALRRRFVA